MQCSDELIHVIATKRTIEKRIYIGRSNLDPDLTIAALPSSENSRSSKSTNAGLMASRSGDSAMRGKKPGSGERGLPCAMP